MKKRILIVSHFAGSPQHGMVLRNFMIGREWVRQGHQVTILASGFSHYRATQPSTQGWSTVEEIEGVRFIWMKGFRYHATSATGRVLAMGWFSAQCYLRGITDRTPFDIVVASSPHPFVIYPAARIARKNDAYLVYDIRDLWPLTPIHLGGHSPRHPFIRALQHAEDFACTHADLVIAVQPNAEMYLRGRGLEGGRFLTVANGYSSEDSPPASLRSDYADQLIKLKDQGFFLLGYCGTLGTANAMHLLIQALARADNRVHTAIVGDGPDKSSLKALAIELGIADRVHMLDSIPKTQVPSFLALMDAAYVGGHPSPLYKYGTGLTKLNDYQAAAKPIIYGLGDPKNAVRESGGGIEYIPGSIEDLTLAINQLAHTSPEELTTMGLKGKRWMEDNRQLASISAEVLTKLDQLEPRY